MLGYCVHGLSGWTSLTASAASQLWQGPSCRRWEVGKLGRGGGLWPERGLVLKPHKKIIHKALVLNPFLLTFIYFYAYGCFVHHKNACACSSRERVLVPGK